MSRIIRTVALAGAILVAAPTAALAHDCLNASRSDTGSQNASHGNWVYISEDEVVEVIAMIAGVDPDDNREAFLAAVAEAGHPTSFSIFVGKLVIGANPTTFELVAAYQDSTKSFDGKGIDHADAMIPAYVALMLQVAAD